MSLAVNRVVVWPCYFNWGIPAIFTISCWLSCQVGVLYQYWNTLLIDRWVLIWIGHSQATLDVWLGEVGLLPKSDLHVVRHHKCYYAMQLKFDKIVHSKAYQLRILLSAYWLLCKCQKYRTAGPITPYFAH